MNKTPRPASRAESRYFITAQKMDEAFLALLDKKDLSYITVKEICERAGVNRSTFYLHYETIGDLLEESIEYLNRDFYAHMQQDYTALTKRLETCPEEELCFVTPEYLLPYLSYIRSHRRLIRTALANAGTLRLNRTYERMFRHVFTPILTRYRIPAADQHYMMAFYVQGLVAIVAEWLKGDCADSIEHVAAVMQFCVAQK